MTTSGIKAFLEILSACRVRYIFGNPGSTELPLTDALADFPQIEYILALQEIPAMAMADGYAQASRTPGVVNLHISCGLGNAMGMLYNAYREGTPLLVTAGQQDRRLAFEEPILQGDMTAVARPWTKWAAEVQRIEDLPSAVRRAVQTALAPPTGPVFLSLPVDVQTGEADLDLTPPQIPDFLVRPPREAVRQAAAVLAAAKNPAILVGSRVVEADAVAELVAVAELLAAPVIHEAATSHGRASFPSDHQLFAPLLPFWSPDVRERLAEFDVLLAVGIKLPQQYIYHKPARAVPEHVRIVQLDDNPWELGKNYPLAVGVIGHPRPSLAELAAELSGLLTAAYRAEAKKRLARWKSESEKRRRSLAAKAESQWHMRPMTPLALMESLARILPRDAAVVEESPTTTMGGYFELRGALKNPDGHFAQRGWALGWGMGCALGVKLAWPERPVLAIIGDGSAMYAPQTLWSAARYRLPVTFVISNNGEYKILKDCAKVLHLPAAREDRFVGLDILDPAIDFTALGESMGVPSCRVDGPEELSEVVADGLEADGPRLVEVAVRHPDEM